MIKNPKPMHPGTVLDEVYMKELGLNQSQLAEKCGCSPRKINEIVNGKRSISPDFSLVLEKVLGTTAEMWVRIQAEYDLAHQRYVDSNHLLVAFCMIVRAPKHKIDFPIPSSQSRLVRYTQIE